MKKILLASTLAASILLADPNSYEQTANKVAKELLKTLGGNLKKHLKANGPINALHFCSTHAYNLTQKVSDKFGKDIDVKRISIKPRNPANTPDENEAEILLKMEQQVKAGQKPKSVVVETPVRAIVYKPLVINKKACLICHGDLSKRPKLAKAIKDIYPADKATGYKMGDFRGAIVVTIKKGEKR